MFSGAGGSSDVGEAALHPFRCRPGVPGSGSPRRREMAAEKNGALPDDAIECPQPISWICQEVRRVMRPVVVDWPCHTVPFHAKVQGALSDAPDDQNTVPSIRSFAWSVKCWSVKQKSAGG